ncbi:hypothetical protein TIFTF001_030111 [Ficus carica]|uniref:Uncharacterized protein n=1 Tax=Ficus carica TaxID=3494 RepID=A0AA88DSN8_FICCA|nr:hypothetical protein TIFTF001_030111 [Ficus carica]
MDTWRRPIGHTVPARLKPVYPSGTLGGRPDRVTRTPEPAGNAHSLRQASECPWQTPHWCPHHFEVFPLLQVTRHRVIVQDLSDQAITSGVVPEIFDINTIQSMVYFTRIAEQRSRRQMLDHKLQLRFRPNLSYREFGELSD